MLKGVNFKVTATEATGRAIDTTRRRLRGLGRDVAGMNSAGRSWNKGLNANRRAVQQFGFQMSDFAIQIAGGQSAMLAFTQQGGQMLQFFGPAGAVAAALLAVFGSLAIAFTKSGQSLSDLLPLMGVLEGQVGGLVNAIRQFGSIMVDVANVIVNNLDQIIITTALVVGWYATKWVAAMVAARVATLTFVGALVALRTVLIRLGFTALIVAAGYLIERFLTLVKGAGSFADAMAILSDVARFVFADIDRYMSILVLGFQRGARRMQLAFINALKPMAQAFDDFSNAIISKWNQMFGGTGALRIDVGWNVADQLGEAAARIEGEIEGIGNSIDELWSRRFEPVWDRLREAMQAGESERIDVRDWFGGSGEAEGGGGKGGKNPLKDIAKEVETTFDAMQKTIGQSMLSSFKALTQGTKSLADVALDTLTQIGNKMIDILMTPVIENVAGNLAGGLLKGLGGLGANIPIEMPSFDGGGYTGSGPRTGGLDGRGGKLALLHPNETVIDHNKGQGLAPVNVHMTINTPDTEGFRKSRGQIEAEIARAAEMGARGN